MAIDIVEVKKFLTSDGWSFDTFAEASQHVEECRLRAWLEARMPLGEVPTFMGRLLRDWEVHWRGEGE